MAARIGIDLGGTKIELVVLAADGSVRWRRRVATPQGDYAGTLRAIVALIHDAETATGISASVGIGTPGSPSPRNGRIRNANSTCLNGQPLQRNRSLIGVLFPPAPTRNNPSHVHQGGAGSAQGDSDQQQVAAAWPSGMGNCYRAVCREWVGGRGVLHP